MLIRLPFIHFSVSFSFTTSKAKPDYVNRSFSYELTYELPNDLRHLGVFINKYISGKSQHSSSDSQNPRISKLNVFLDLELHVFYVISLTFLTLPPCAFPKVILK